MDWINHNLSFYDIQLDFHDYTDKVLTTISMNVNYFYDRFIVYILYLHLQFIYSFSPAAISCCSAVSTL